MADEMGIDPARMYSANIDMYDDSDEDDDGGGDDGDDGDDDGDDDSNLRVVNRGTKSRPRFELESDGELDLDDDTEDGSANNSDARSPAISSRSSSSSSERSGHYAHARLPSSSAYLPPEDHGVRMSPKQIVEQSLTDIHKLINHLRATCTFDDVPSEPKQLILLQALETLNDECVEGIMTFVEDGYPLHTMCDPTCAKRASDAYTGLFEYFLEVYPYTNMRRDSGHGLVLLRELILLTVAYCRQITMAFAPESVVIYAQQTRMSQFPPAIMYNTNLYTHPIATFTACQTMTAIHSIYACSNTAVFSPDLRKLFYFLLFRAYYLLTHAHTEAVADIVDCTIASASDPTMLCLSPEVLADVSILSYEMLRKFSVFDMFSQVVHTDAIPRARKILFSEATMLVYWLSSAASNEDGSPMRTYYIRQQLRVGEAEMYRRLFSASAVDDPNFVLGTMRMQAEFQRIQEDGLRSPAQMLADYVRTIPDEHALFLTCYHTIMSFFGGKHPDLAKRLGSVFVLEHEISAVMGEINDKLHPVLVQVYNHLQLMCEGRVLYMYNNPVCSIVAWFREIYRRHAYSLCGVDIRHSTVDMIFDARRDLRTNRVRPFQHALRDLLVRRASAHIVFDYDPFRAMGDTSGFDYSLYPDNLMVGRPPPMPIPITDPHVLHIHQQLQNRIGHYTNNESAAHAQSIKY